MIARVLCAGLRASCGFIATRRIGYRTGWDSTSAAWIPRGAYIKTPAGIAANLTKPFGGLKTKKDKQGFWHKASCITIRTGALSTSSAGSCTGVILINVACWLFGYRRLRGIHEDKINSRLENMA